MGTSEKIMHYANFNITYGPTEDPMLTHFEDIIWPAFLSDFKRGKKNEHPLFYLSDIALKEISGDMVLVGNYIKDTQYDIRTTVQNGELVSTPSSVPTAPYSRFIIFLKDIQKVWNIVLAVDKYNSWRSDLSKTEIINDKQFIEYTKNGYATTFTVTVAEPYKRWEFDMENSNMKGHWIGVFIDKGNETQIDFTENVIPKKWFMKPFVKTYLKKQQKQFVLDLKKALE